MRGGPRGQPPHADRVLGQGRGQVRLLVLPRPQTPSSRPWTARP
jgi:hypothetical protein